MIWICLLLLECARKVVDSYLIVDTNSRDMLLIVMNKPILFIKEIGTISSFNRCLHDNVKWKTRFTNLYGLFHKHIIPVLQVVHWSPHSAPNMENFVIYFACISEQKKDNSKSFRQMVLFSILGSCSRCEHTNLL